MQVKARDLKPGMMIDQWDLERGPDSTIKEVRIIERPGFKYNTVKITFESGRVERPFPTEVCKFSVIA